MPRVDWQAIEANLSRVAVQLDVRLGGGVAMRAKTLQGAQAELHPVATMWGDVIGHCCGNDAALFSTHLAQRIDPKLMLGSFPVTLELWPIAWTSV
jgi:hypothetical protein